MKKLISLFVIFILVLAVAGCGGAQQQHQNRGELTVAVDHALTQDLLAYFQANQDCIVTCTLLDAKTDYAKLGDTASAALVKDEATAEKLRAAGWKDAEEWTPAQAETNTKMFNFTVLTAPKITESGKKAVKLLTDWLVGDGSYERTVTTVSGGCSCKRTQTVVTFTSDAPELFKSGRFSALTNP